MLTRRPEVLNLDHVRVVEDERNYPIVCIVGKDFLTSPMSTMSNGGGIEQDQQCFLCDAGPCSLCAKLDLHYQENDSTK